jgi:group II intron reverse transcriptase/maturase
LAFVNAEEEGKERTLPEHRLSNPGSLQNLQRQLYHKSKAEPSYRFYTLWDKVYRRDVLEEAWRRVRANRGTGGIDGETIRSVERFGVEPFLSSLAADLKAKTYQAPPVRRTWIPKSDGKKRPLGIPTIRDRVAQAAVKIVIEPLFEAIFLDGSYGFRPKRGAHQAVRDVTKYLNYGKVYVIDADIRDFFGQIPHDQLMRVIAQKIADGQVLRMIRQWLDAGVLEEGQALRYAITGTPQGGVISPILSNAYLHQLDQRWNDGGYAERFWWDAHLIRYADDLVILTSKPPPVLRDVLQSTLKDLGLELHPDKTRIVNANEGSFDFLGFNFRKVWNRSKTKRFALVTPSQKAQARLRDKIRTITHRQRPVSTPDMIEELNPVLRGWFNYFGIGHSSRSFNRIRRYTVRKVRRYIRFRQKRRGIGRWELTHPVLVQRYGLLGDFSIRDNALAFTAHGSRRACW